MYSIGEFVVHPMHGAGQIEDIVEEKVAGVRKEYYVFSMPVGGLVLKIPTAGTGTNGMRPVISRGEAQELMNAIPALSVENNANWNKRYQENLDRLKSGDLYEVARVIKGLVHRENRRGLSTGERKMLYNAKQIMISEIVLAEKCTYEDAESRLMDAVAQTKRRRSKTEKAKAAERAEGSPAAADSSAGERTVGLAAAEAAELTAAEEVQPEAEA